jgi:hypothetical protein
MDNVYYDPAAFNLEVVGSFEFAEPDYSFDMCVVWKNERGQFFVGTDSGCSCPCPFEDQTLDDLDGPYDRSGLKTRLEYLANDKASDRAGYNYGNDIATLLRSVREVLNKV